MLRYNIWSKRISSIESFLHSTKSVWTQVILNLWYYLRRDMYLVCLRIEIHIKTVVCDNVDWDDEGQW